MKIRLKPMEAVLYDGTSKSARKCALLSPDKLHVGDTANATEVLHVHGGAEGNVPVPPNTYIAIHPNGELVLVSAANAEVV